MYTGSNDHCPRCWSSVYDYVTRSQVTLLNDVEQAHASVYGIVSSGHLDKGVGEAILWTNRERW
jgi:hypothetical protein